MADKSANAWRKRRTEGEQWETPSGLVIRVRQINIFDLVKSGKVPQTLQAEFEKLGNTKGGLLFGDIAKMESSLDVIMEACVTEPRIVPEDKAVDDYTVHVSEFGLDDKVAVFQHANALSTELKPFLTIETSP